MNWIIENREWIFSGIGVSIISILVSLLIRKRNKSIKMRQNSGSNSTNIQIGGDYNG